MDLRRISPLLTREQKLAVVSVADVKAQARVTHADEDDLLAGYIEAAYDYLAGPDGWLGRCALLEEDYEFYAERTVQSVELPMRPWKNGHALTFEVRAADGTYSPVAADAYHLIPNGHFPIVRKAGVWSMYGACHPQAYRFRFTAGFGGAADIPSPIKLGITMLAGHWYANRETVGMEGRTVGEEIRYGLRALCGRFRVAHDHR